MLEEFLVLIGLLLALYGLSCVITTLAVWFTTPSRRHPSALLVVLCPGDPVKASLTNARERLKNCGLHHTVRVVAVNAGLDEKQQEKAAAYCRLEGIGFCRPEELPAIMRLPPFQTRKNDV